MTYDLAAEPAPAPRLSKLSCTAPRMYAVDDFLSDDEIEHILSITTDADRLAALGVQTNHNNTGFFCELPVDSDPTLREVVSRMERTLHVDNDFGSTLRFRHYRVGESHPPHIDEYQIDNLWLIATAMLYLSDTEEGGATVFPRAQPEPVTLNPRKGRLVMWFSHKPDGSVDQAALHEALPIVRGEKITLTNFIYKPLRFAALDPLSDVDTISRNGSAGPEPYGSNRPKFYCVNDNVPTETTDLLREACEKRDVEYIEIDAPSFDFDPDRQLSAGDLLYRPGITRAATRTEQFLFAPGVATFYKYPDGIFFDAMTYPLHFQRAGLPVPRTVYCATGSRELLKRFVEQLGGFPIVFKITGGQRGVGVMRVDSFPALYSLVDYALWQGNNPLLCAYVDNAVHWRVVVIGDRAVAAYKNKEESDDFRTYGSDDLADFTADVDPKMAEIAVRAVDVLHNEMGGVDLLRHPSGRYYLLESNFPCYFPHAQKVAGIDVAGAMIEYLLKKAARLKAEASEAGVR